MILENVLRDLMFEVPTDQTIAEIYITEETITKNAPPQIIHRDNKEIA